MNRTTSVWILFIGCLTTAILSERAAAGQTIEYNRDVRPILSDSCFVCHGPDARNRQAGLRLDTPEGGTAELESGAVAVVPGKSMESELLRRVTSTDDAERMPPPETRKQLTEQQIAILRQWIDEGAEWQGHWSFLPINRSEPPQVEETQGIKNGIDEFIVSKLIEKGLSPSPEADPATLVRRLSLDLTGLPPDSADVERFVKDPSEEAYEQLVDQYLASPRYGERLAVWWLDLVRYADSVGYHGDQPVSVYPFREYVIRAFNDNKRFDQFTTEQLAGDLLPDATVENKIASGYNRLGMMSAEGGVQPKEYLAKYIAERVRNASGVWLGVTLGCAECHDHKFDPFAARDFYRFEAFFADIEERGLYSGANVDGNWGPKIELPTPEQSGELARLDAEHAELNQTLDQETPELASAQVSWEQSVAPQVEWTALRPTEATSDGGVSLTVQDDLSILASGPNPEKATYTLTFPAPAGMTALRIEAIPDDSLPSKGCGRAANGNFVLTELTAKLQSATTRSEEPLVLENATESYSQNLQGDKDSGRWKAAVSIDGNDHAPRGWAVAEEAALANHAVFQTHADVAGGEGSILRLTFAQNHGARHTLGRFRVSVTVAPRPVQALGAGLPRNVRDRLAVPAAERNGAQRAELAKYYRSIAPALEPTRKQIKVNRAAYDKLKKNVATTLVTVAVEPRPVRILPRGNWMDDSGEVVTPGVPASLPQPAESETRLTRLDLARWLVDKENPLTARVLANRLWKLYFGAGLSKKLDDVGAQGDWPSHPELLDWLARDLIENGWDIKRLIRTMVLSRTYRQTSVTTPELREKDPYNIWLARQARFRMDAEMVRDNALAISGLLVERIGGPSVKPYQPAGYWAYLNFPTREWENGTGDELYRRGLYTHWQRQYLHPSMLAFDGPSREECTADRPRSNTPLQALALLNDPTYVEAARSFAVLIARQGGSPEQRIDFAVNRAIARHARAEETQVLRALYEKHHQQFEANRDAAAQLITVGQAKTPSDVDPAELAAWTSVARAILNMHATVTRN